MAQLIQIISAKKRSNLNLLKDKPLTLYIYMTNTNTAWGPRLCKRWPEMVLKKCTPSMRETHFGEDRVPGERQSRRIVENYKPWQKHNCLKMCAPSRRESHLGRFGVSGPCWHRPPASNPYRRLRSRKAGG